MSEFKGTPGPWHVSGTSVDAGDVHADGVRVAKCWTSTFAPPREEAAANARLIATAPELLAAAEALLPEVERLRACLACVHDGYPDEVRAADLRVSELRAVIARARA